jgi:hypothetical protein
MKRLKDENNRLKEMAMKRDAILSQCETKIKAYEGAAKDQQDAGNRVKALERDMISLRQQESYFR